MAYIAKTMIGTNIYPIGSCLYGTCSTAAGTAAKVVTMADFDTLMTGVAIQVKFDNANTASTPTLNVGGTGAKNIFYRGAQITTSDTKSLLAGVCTFVYDGTQWCLTGGQEVGGGIMWVTLTMGSNGIYTADKTYTEIKNALNANINVLGRASAPPSGYSTYTIHNRIFHVDKFDPSPSSTEDIIFCNDYQTYLASDDIVETITYVFSIKSNNTVTLNSYINYSDRPLHSTSNCLNIAYSEYENKYVVVNYLGDSVSPSAAIDDSWTNNFIYARLLAGSINDDPDSYLGGDSGYYNDDSELFYLNRVDFDPNYVYWIYGDYYDDGGVILYFNNSNGSKSITIKAGLQDDGDWSSAEVTVTTKDGDFSVQKVTVTIASNANYALINAPTVSGQRFVCWIGAATSGWLGSVFIPDMGSASTSVWKVSGSGNVDCFALYQKI